MFFAFPYVLSVASFQSFVPLSFNSATFSTAHKRSSFTSLHEPMHRHYAICLQFSSNGFVLQSKNTNPANAIAGSFCSKQNGQTGRAWLKNEVEDYWNKRTTIIELLKYLSTTEHIDHMGHWESPATYAKYLVELVSNDGV